MLVIGIAGGVASGKSLVARCFQCFGAEILDADRVGHEVLLDANVVDIIVSPVSYTHLTLPTIYSV